MSKNVLSPPWLNPILFFPHVNFLGPELKEEPVDHRGNFFRLKSEQSSGASKGGAAGATAPPLRPIL